MKNDDKLKKIKEALLAIMRESRRWLLLVGTGASVAMDAELGMRALARHLLATIPENSASWKSIAKRLKQEDDLETALTKINLTESLQSEIARHTASFVAQKDEALRDDILTGKKTWVGEPFLQQLRRGLSPTWPRLPVITPNYDMLIEYACSKANIPYITGYYGGIIRCQDWTKARERLYQLNSVTMGGKRRDIITPIQCVELMKVHGSINLFRRNSNGIFVENDTWTTGCPADYTPMIAPPGDIKNQEALNFHDRLFGEALQAIDKATAFFVIGYGFRDKHIHQKILERVCSRECPLIVLTLDPSKELGRLPSMGKNVWVVTGIQNQANGKTDPSGTRFANSKEELSGEFGGVALWQSDVFTEQILGG
ncbi:MAG: SIR2 family protein [Deltaproteobacteria bacterium]|nr:SIR2 family protein [Deltaproteobacteria bacterium]